MPVFLLPCEVKPKSHRIVAGSVLPIASKSGLSASTAARSHASAVSNSFLSFDICRAFSLRSLHPYAVKAGQNLATITGNEFDLTERERIRWALIDYMKAHKIGVPTLAARIKGLCCKTHSPPSRWVQCEGRERAMSDFKGRHFEGEVVLWAVRWYCRYGVSYRDLEQMMGERGVSVDHSTIYRWVQKYAPEIEKRLRWQWRGPRSTSWRIDETYVKVRGQWAYLYRAVDKHGNTIDFYLSPTRNTAAAKRFLGKALSGLK